MESKECLEDNFHKSLKNEVEDFITKLKSENLDAYNRLIKIAFPAIDMFEEITKTIKRLENNHEAVCNRIEQKEQEQLLAEDIYSECGVEIRYCDCQTIAQELIKLGWKK